MARYLMLLFEDEANWVDASPEEQERMFAEHGEFTAKVPKLGGEIVGGEALEPTTTATTIRGGQVTDGPFLETKEALGGYYLIEAPDLDTAIAIAKECPVGTGGVEVRPVMDVGSD